MSLRSIVMGVIVEVWSNLSTAETLSLMLVIVTANLLLLTCTLGTLLIVPT
jgi:hypothetical protein